MTFTIRNFDAVDKEWLVQQHDMHYREVEGFDATFAPLVAQIIDDFIARHDPKIEAGWIAESEGRRLGSIFSVRIDDATAKLRLFYVTQDARGTGVAQALLDQCLQFARAHGFTKLTLWTHQSHLAAGAIYRRNGFELVAEKQVHSFGRDLVEQTWQFRF